MLRILENIPNIPNISNIPNIPNIFKISDWVCLVCLVWLSTGFVWFALLNDQFKISTRVRRSAGTRWVLVVVGDDQRPLALAAMFGRIESGAVF